MISAETTARLLRDLLAEGKHASLTIISESMEPLLLVGDQVRIEAVAIGALQQGDIITIESSKALYTHRFCTALSADDARYLITRGDQPLAYDPPWPESALIGRIVACKRNDKWLDLRSGSGKRLNRHLAQIAAFEEIIYGGANPHLGSLQTDEQRLLGRWLRQTPVRHFILRAIRSSFLRWSRMLVRIAYAAAGSI